MKSMAANVSINISLAIFAGALIWAASPFITNQLEPWDSESRYYAVSLITIGFSLGLARPKQIWSHPIGIVVGQLIYILAFLPIGPLFAVGALSLVFYSFLTFAGAFLGVKIHHMFNSKPNGQNSDDGANY